MNSPFTDQPMTIIKEWRTMTFRNEEFKILFHAYRCMDTGELFEDDEFSQLNYEQVITQYNEKHNTAIPTR